MIENNNIIFEEKKIHFICEIKNSLIKAISME